MHRRVDRHALGAFAQGLVLGVDVRQVQTTTEDGLDIALLGSLGAGALHVLKHAGIAGKIAVDISLGLLAVDADLLGQPERAHAVDQAEVDRLGAAAHVIGDLRQVHAEHLARRRAVHVQIVAEGVQQAFILGQMRHDPKFDLRVIRSQ